MRRRRTSRSAPAGGPSRTAGHGLRRPPEAGIPSAAGRLGFRRAGTPWRGRSRSWLPSESDTRKYHFRRLRVNRLPAARPEPALDLVQTVGTPERLAVDEEEGRAEHAALDRAVRLFLEPRLHGRALDGRHQLVRRYAERGPHLAHRLGSAEVPALAPVGV